MPAEAFELLQPGSRITCRARTVTETDVVHFCMLTGNWLSLHADAEYAKGTRFGQRVAQGSLVLSLAIGALPYDAEVVEAFAGLDGLRFHQPCFIGDTLQAYAEVVELLPREESRQLSTIDLRSRNQRGQDVMSCRVSLLVRAARP